MSWMSRARIWGGCAGGSARGARGRAERRRQRCRRGGIMVLRPGKPGLQAPVGPRAPRRARSSRSETDSAASSSRSAPRSCPRTPSSSFRPRDRLRRNAHQLQRALRRRGRPVPGLGRAGRGAMSQASFTLDEAFAHCEARVKAHYENFPVGLFVPKDKRRYVHALYAFARVADDFADEKIYEGIRAQKLDEWEARLHAAYQGEVEGPIFTALSETVRRLDDPEAAAARPALGLQAGHGEGPLRDLGRAARLLPALGGSRRPTGAARLRLPRSGAAAAVGRDLHGLQLANHWQDVAVDLRKERIYIPRELLVRHGVPEWDLNAGRVTAGFESLMKELVERTRALFATRPAALRPRQPRPALRDAPHVARRSGILDRIETVGYDVFHRRPSYGLVGKLALAWRAWRWKSGETQRYGRFDAAIALGAVAWACWAAPVHPRALRRGRDAGRGVQLLLPGARFYSAFIADACCASTTKIDPRPPPARRPRLHAVPALDAVRDALRLDRRPRPADRADARGPVRLPPGLSLDRARCRVDGRVQDMVILAFSTRRDGMSLARMIKTEVGPGPPPGSLLGPLHPRDPPRGPGLFVVNAPQGQPLGHLHDRRLDPDRGARGLYMTRFAPVTKARPRRSASALLIVATAAGHWVAENPTLSAIFTRTDAELAVAVVIYGFLAAALPAWLLLRAARQHLHVPEGRHRRAARRRHPLRAPGRPDAGGHALRRRQRADLRRRALPVLLHHHRLRGDLGLPLADRERHDAALPRPGERHPRRRLRRHAHRELRRRDVADRRRDAGARASTWR